MQYESLYISVFPPCSERGEQQIAAGLHQEVNSWLQIRYSSATESLVLP
jgi:hypothetical protein